MHAVSGLCSTTLLCQSAYCDKLCQSVHTYNHLPLPHTKACEQTWNLSTKQRKKKTTAKYFLAKYIPTLLLQWLLAGLGLSLLRASCVPAERGAQGSGARAGTAGSGQGQAGSAGSSLHPAGMGTNARALWRPRNVSNSRTCAEAMLSVLPLQNKVDFP